MAPCLEFLYDLESTMSFSTSATAALQAITREVSMKDLSQTNSDTVMHDASPSFSQSREETQMQEEDEAASFEEVKDERWKQFSKITPFLAVPPEIHLKIMTLLHPIDATCLSLVNKYIYELSPPFLNPHPMDIGAPFSTDPCPKVEGCKHCVPVLYHPAHCELHYHLRSFMPKELKFCSGKCHRYTKCEQQGYSDSSEICGECGTSYRRRYERGRRMLDMMRPGEKQIRLNKWYNSTRST
ncbi:uncharacterized protein LY89DRAFT_684174 [Mollisia scopiformis]|uniref:F-box domain-containing protein n=1 Tax=Mollisia scopiformis TaxID=149040 RepID=A0A194XDL9_MOLSC|nr:uncharacterized protein LY89DRAFT_684174 [Mollisia scopiformis]KUJ18249.1 hypothetical protein LY89DRAFT_684174 [Mollisia scopiformis]